MDEDRIHATYLVETPLELERAVRALASEGSTGTFVPVPGEAGAVRDRFGTRLEAVEELAAGDRAQLTGARRPAAPAAGRDGAAGRAVVAGEHDADPLRVNRARVTVSVPLELTGSDLTTVGASLLGNVFELSEVSGLRLERVAFPPRLVRDCPRPRYGVAGSRALHDVHERPLFGSIVRPALGLTPAETAAAVRELLAAGVDFLKDDELLIDPPANPLRERVAAVMGEVDAHAERTGRRAVYAFNVSGAPDEMLRRQDVVRAAGGTAVQVNLAQVGLAAVAHLRRHGELLIHGHRSGWAVQGRSPALGLSFAAYAALWRLAGADQLIVSGLRSKYWESDDEAVANVAACLEPLDAASGLDDRALPVLAAGQWGGQIPDSYARTGTADWLYLAGGGVTNHPLGAAAGVRALHAAWEAARDGVALEQAARDEPALAASIAAFGTTTTEERG